MKILCDGETYTFMSAAFGSKEGLIGGNLIPKKTKIIIVHDEKGNIHWLKAEKCKVVV